MVGPTVNQQAKSGIPTESGPVTTQRILAMFAFCQNSVQAQSLIAKFNNWPYLNSMINPVMGFFVHPVPGLVNAPRRDQAPASFDAEMDRFHLVTR